MIEVRCPRDGELYRAEESQIGRSLRCWKCGQPVPIDSPREGAALPAAAGSAQRTRARYWVHVRPSSWSPGQSWRRGLAGLGVLTALVIFAIISLRSLPTERRETARPPGPTRSIERPSLARDGLGPTVEEVLREGEELRRLAEEVQKANEEVQKAARALPGIGPMRPARAPVSLPNGTEVQAITGPNGLGELRIRNGTATDAVAKLRDSGPPFATRRAVYIRAGSEVTLRGLPPQTFNLIFALGVDWDTATSGFRAARSYQRFQDVLLFTESPIEGGRKYKTYEAGLDPIIGGNARTSPITQEEFERD